MTCVECAHWTLQSAHERNPGWKPMKRHANSEAEIPILSQASLDI
jgi:hypothetical protein